MSIIIRIKISIIKQERREDMARPKSTAPTKQRLNITVSEETRKKLDMLSLASKKSISELVAEWTERESKKENKNKGKEKQESVKKSKNTNKPNK